MNTPTIREDITQDEAVTVAIESIRLGQLLDQAALLAIEIGVSEKTFVNGARDMYRSEGAAVHKQTEAILKAAATEPIEEES